MPKRSSNSPAESPAHIPVRSAHNKGKTQPDVNEVAFLIAQRATRESDVIIEEKPETPTKNPAAVTLGRLGGLKGGKARAQALTPEKRAEIARKAAAKRWGTPD